MLFAIIAVKLANKEAIESITRLILCPETSARYPKNIFPAIIPKVVTIVKVPAYETGRSNFVKAKTG